MYRKLKSYGLIAGKRAAQKGRLPGAAGYSFSSMRILIIGGTRFIGPWVVERLLGQQHQVMLFHRGTAAPEGLPEVRHVHGDRKNIEEFKDTFRKWAPDAVLDLYALTEGDVHALLKAIKGICGRLVVISSMDVYRAFGLLHSMEEGPLEPVPLAESAPLRGKLYPYRGKMEGFEDYEKILVEQAALQENSLTCTILRLPMVYGPGDYQHRLFGYLKRMDDQRPAILMEEHIAGWRWTKGYVKDIAKGIVLALTHEAAGKRIFNIGESETPSMLAWVQKLGELVGWRGQVLSVPRGVLPPQLSMPIDARQHMLFDSSKIREELGYAEEHDLEGGLRESIAWERENPPGAPAAGLFDYAEEDRILHELRHGGNSRA
jgi:nucleoside-diphosphate-sugar epimerase